MDKFTGENDINGQPINIDCIVKDRYGMVFVVIKDEEENRFMGVTLCDELWNERQGDVRYIRKSSIQEHQLQVVCQSKLEYPKYQELKKERELDDC